MNILPNQLVLLDDSLRTAGAVTRLDPMGAIAGRTLKESDYDRLLVAHRDVVADALREAGIIERTSVFRYLGKILSIDVLFAEVDQETESFRRLVLIEDKLFRNPEARREVLGQILDYARVLKEEIDFSRLCELLSDEHRSWLDANDDLIEEALRDGDFLLLVCGDRIQPRVVEYVKHLRERLDPLISLDVALMSIAIFSNGTQHVLVPYVVASITAERGITIKVVVQTSSGEMLPASVRVDERDDVDTGPAYKKRIRMEIEDLLEAIRNTAGDSAVSVAQSLFDYATELGAEVIPMGASASVRVSDPKTNRRSTLFVVTKNGTFFLGWLDRWTRNSGVAPEVADTYLSRLTDILGQSPLGAGTGGRNVGKVSLTDLVPCMEAVLSEIRVAIKALRHDETDCVNL